MKEYIRERERQEKTSRMVGGALALGISVCAVRVVAPVMKSRAATSMFLNFIIFF